MEEVQEPVIKPNNIRKEALNHVFTLPYVVSDTMLYFHTAVDFFDQFSRYSSRYSKWRLPQYVVMEVLIVPLGLSLYSSLIEINGKSWGWDTQTRFAALRAKARRILGIPAALIKTFVSSASFYLTVRVLLPNEWSIALAVVLGISMLPSQLSILWGRLSTGSSNHTHFFIANKLQRRNNKLKYFLIHFSTLLYALGNSSLYLWSLLNLPRKWGVSTTAIEWGTTLAEHLLYGGCCFLVLFPFAAAYISYSHLNENLVGLIDNEPLYWTKLKRTLKHLIGPTGATIKAINSCSSFYSFVKAGIPKALAIGFTTLAGLSGVFTQTSILVMDPIQRNAISKERSYGPSDTENSLVIITEPEHSEDILLDHKNNEDDENFREVEHKNTFSAKARLPFFKVSYEKNIKTATNYKNECFKLCSIL